MMKVKMIYAEEKLSLWDFPDLELRDEEEFIVPELVEEQKSSGGESGIINARKLNESCFQFVEWLEIIVITDEIPLKDKIKKFMTIKMIGSMDYMRAEI
jgi:hypothetical protein